MSGKELNHSVPDHTLVRHERDFRDIFSKLNKMLPAKYFITSTAILLILWGTLFSLLYADLKEYKDKSTERQIDIIRELGEVKSLVYQIRNGD